MLWKVELTPGFAKALKRLDKPVQRRILTKLLALELLDHPEDGLVPYEANLAGLWKLRVGDYRVIIDLDHGGLVVIALDVGHRSRVYKNR